MQEPSTSSCGLSPKTPQRHLYRPSWPAPRSILRSSCQLQGTSSVAPTTAGSFGVCCPSAASTSGLASPSQARHLPGASTSPTFSYPAVNAPASEDDNVLLIPPALAAAAAALSPEDAALFDADMRDLEACGLVEWQSADDLHAAALVRLAGSTDWARLAAGLNASPVGWADEEAADRLLLSPQWREAMAHQQAHAATAAGGDAVSAMQAAVAKLRQEQDGAAEEQVEQEPQLAGTLSSAFSMSHEDRLLFGADMADLEAFGLVDWQVADLEQRVTSTRLQRLSEQMAQMLADMQAEGRQRQQQQQWQWQGREGMQQRGGSWCGVEACGAPGAPCGAEAPRLVAVV
ncbi:hypothetical protein HYH02_005526 [Chlamydomonas schloesseri]|uniref:Uncharacterized protein n=1 Tax=Chlamydomonas schloesseri TaxID=2026947 RepID=A0A835WLC9_9CHLO|nr:hypothetical protein HYH02_005526 [Chlamydomonas schloesseri]|eukprot:KAG2449374.1 hypothetical protein HYH02_005526 [Chlamydomonas schloesseri]